MIKRHNKDGFNLLELLIVISIISILAVLAINNYQKYVRKSRRTEAISTLLNLQLAEEKYRVSNNSYGNLATIWNNQDNTENGYYTLTISNLSSSSYTLTATATSTQTNDKQASTLCNLMQINVDGTTVTKTPVSCWQ